MTLRPTLDHILKPTLTWLHLTELLKRFLMGCRLLLTQWRRSANQQVESIRSYRAKLSPARSAMNNMGMNKAAGGHNQRIRPPVESRKSKVKAHMKKSSFQPAPETFTFTASSCRNHDFSCFSSHKRQAEALTRRPEATTKQPAAVKVQVSGAGQSAMSSPPATCDLSLSLPSLPSHEFSCFSSHKRQAEALNDNR